MNPEWSHTVIPKRSGKNGDQLLISIYLVFVSQSPGLCPSYCLKMLLLLCWFHKVLRPQSVRLNWRKVTTLHCTIFSADIITYLSKSDATVPVWVSTKAERKVNPSPWCSISEINQQVISSRAERRRENSVRVCLAERSWTRLNSSRSVPINDSLILKFMTDPAQWLTGHLSFSCTQLSYSL